jgi:hypothetical protein
VGSSPMITPGREPWPSGADAAQRPSAVQRPPDLGQRLMQATQMAIGNVRLALANLHQPWSAQTQQKMFALYGGGAFTPEGRAAIGKALADTLRGLEYTASVGGANLRIYDFARDRPGGNREGAVAGKSDRGGVDFSTGYVRDSNDTVLAHLMTHELSHVYANTHDNWYLDGNFNRKPTYQTGGTVQDVPAAPFTFDNAVHNAATVENCVPVLAKGR